MTSNKAAQQRDDMQGILHLARTLLVACERVENFSQFRPGGDVLLQLPHYREMQRAALALRVAFNDWCGKFAMTRAPE